MPPVHRLLHITLDTTVLGEGVGARKASPPFLVPMNFQETAGRGSGVSFSRNVAFAKIGAPKGGSFPSGRRGRRFWP
jgi:hypothetical protein